MKVKDLIRILEKANPDSIVIIEDWDIDDKFYYIDRVEERTIEYWGKVVDFRLDELA